MHENTPLTKQSVHSSASAPSPPHKTTTGKCTPAWSTRRPSLQPRFSRFCTPHLPLRLLVQPIFLSYHTRATMLCRVKRKSISVCTSLNAHCITTPFKQQTSGVYSCCAHSSKQSSFGCSCNAMLIRLQRQTRRTCLSEKLPHAQGVIRRNKKFVSQYLLKSRWLRILYTTVSAKSAKFNNRLTMVQQSLQQNPMMNKILVLL
jgi:hypothetical protein